MFLRETWQLFVDRDQYSVSSTPTSQISCPDPTDSRQPLPTLPTIKDSEPVALGASRSKKPKVKNSKIKSMFPEVTNRQEAVDYTHDSEATAKDSSHSREQVPDAIVERLKHSGNLESASLSSYKSGQSEKQPDTNSMSSGDQFFSLPESQSETSSMADGAVGNVVQPDSVLILEEEDEKGNSSHKVEGQILSNAEQDVPNADVVSENGAVKSIPSEENVVQEESSNRRSVFA